MQAEETPWERFRGDLGLALSAWRRSPLLPVASLTVGVAAASGYIFQESVGSAGVFLGLASLFFLGFPGTERIWYLRTFRGQAFSLREAVIFTRRFFGPFLGLGVLITLWALPAYLLVVIFFDSPGTVVLATAIISTSIDIPLTFMTQALAFSTRDAGSAASRGWRFLKEHLSDAKHYVLIPPLAGLVTARAAAPSLPVGVDLALVAVGVLLNLWFKGATAAYYLRHHEVSDDGSVGPVGPELASRKARGKPE